MMNAACAWSASLLACARAFTAPSMALFYDLCCAWVLCPGRKTITGMLRVLDGPKQRPHDAYHRFLRAGAWVMAELWAILTPRMVEAFAPKGVILLSLDDTLFHKTGRKVEGAGIFRDAVRSTSRRVVHAMGLNLVVLTLRVKPPWGGEPLALPINARLHRKGGRTLLDLAEEMIVEVTSWLPQCRFRLCCDGAYASLAGRLRSAVHIVSRMRRDAALFLRPAPRRKGQTGRPPKKGKRLPSPPELARRSTHGWKRQRVAVRGRMVTLDLLARRVLWYRVTKDEEVLLVVVRDPRGRQPDDFFFTTDIEASPASVASDYAARWAIEDTFRSVKQHLGGEHPQTWKDRGPERASMLSPWLYAAVWTWYIESYGTKQTWRPVPWYQAKKTPAFIDALAQLRRVLWQKRVSLTSDRKLLPSKTLTVLIEALARAA